MCAQVKEVCRLVAARSASLAAAAIAGLLRQVWQLSKPLPSSCMSLLFHLLPCPP
jgi:hypothetical protein